MSDSELHIHLFTPDQFKDMRDIWRVLLKESDANPLFMSWEWMYAWWDIYGNKENDSLLVLGAYDKEKLVGLAPLYISHHRSLKGLISTRTIQFIGTRIKGTAGFRSEYLQFITSSNDSKHINDYIARELFTKHKTDEYYLNDLIVNCNTYRSLNYFAQQSRAYTREQGESRTYIINCEQPFPSYVADLGKNTRLKLFNRRKVLESLGDVSVTISGAQDLSSIVSRINNFHVHRWGYQTIQHHHSKFIAALVCSELFTVSSITLFLDKKPLACTLDVLTNGRSYNLQMGFTENLHKKISLGTLTLGYAIEKYCSDQKIKSYDLLAGGGKNSDYKPRVAIENTKLKSLQFILSTKFKHIYWLNDKLKKTCR